MKKQLFQLRLSKVFQQSFSNKLVHLFEEADMRKGHKGLAALASKNGVNVADLRRGEYVIFINRDRSGFKLFTAGHVLAYQKSEDGSEFDLNTILRMPSLFNGMAIPSGKQKLAKEA